MSFIEISKEISTLLLKILPVMDQKNDSELKTLSACIKDIDSQVRGLEKQCLRIPTTRYHVSALKAYEDVLPSLIKGKVPEKIEVDLQKLLQQVISIREEMETSFVPESRFKRKIEELRGHLRAVYHLVDRESLNNTSQSTSNKSVARPSR